MARPAIVQRDGAVVIRGDDFTFERVNHTHPDAVTLRLFDMEAENARLEDLEDSVSERISGATDGLSATYGMDAERTCPSDQAIVRISSSDGGLTCSDIEPDFDIVQARVDESCGANSAIRAISVDGDVTCESAAYTPDFVNVLQRRVGAACSGKQKRQQVSRPASATSTHTVFPLAPFPALIMSR